MSATAPTNVSPAWRAPTWVAAKVQLPSFYLIPVELLENARSGILTVGARHESDRADQRVARMAGSNMGGCKGPVAAILPHTK